jgi:hypothetical protein
MPIVVVCTSCKSRFTVSDQYAGRTGPCPKCKKPITIPKPEQAVVIHEPEPAGAGQPRGGPRVSTKPLPSRDKPVAVGRISAVAGGFAAALAASWIAGRVFGQAGPPVPLVFAAAFAMALPCALVGYAMVRDRELEPYRGSAILIRAAACAAVYAALWGVRSLLPVEATSEMYQWFFIAPIFVAAGGLAALVAFELDWGPAVAHYGFYVIVTATMRWLAGLPPV